MESDSEYLTDGSCRSLVAQKHLLDEIIYNLDDFSDENGEQVPSTDRQNKRARVGSESAEASRNAAGPSHYDIAQSERNYQDTQLIHDGTDSPTTVENMLALPDSPESAHVSAEPLPTDAGASNALSSESYPATQSLRDAETQLTLEFQPSVFADSSREVPPLPQADSSAPSSTSLRTAFEHQDSLTRAGSLDIGIGPARNLPIPHEYPAHVRRQMWPSRTRTPPMPQPIPPMELPPPPHFPPTNLDDYAPGAFRNTLLFMRERAQRAQQEYEEAEAMFERGYRMEHRFAQRARVRQQLAAGLGFSAAGSDRIPQRAVPMMFPDEPHLVGLRSSQRPAPADAVKHFKTMTRREMLKMQKEEGEQDGGGKSREVDVESCPICLDEYTSDTLVTRLSCSHWLHKPCLDSWLERADTCPLCRNPVAPHQTQGFPSFGYRRLERGLPETPRTISDNIRTRRTADSSISAPTGPGALRRLRDARMLAMGRDVAGSQHRAAPSVLHLQNRPRLQPRTGGPAQTELLEDNDPQQVEDRMLQQAILASLKDICPDSQARGSSAAAGPSQQRPSIFQAESSSRGNSVRPPSRHQARMNAADFYSTMDDQTEHDDSHRVSYEDNGASVFGPGPPGSRSSWTMDRSTGPLGPRPSSRVTGMSIQATPQALQGRPSQWHAGSNTTRRTPVGYMDDDHTQRLVDVRGMTPDALTRIQPTPQHMLAGQTVHRSQRYIVRRPIGQPAMANALVGQFPEDGPTSLSVYLSPPQLTGARRAGQPTDQQQQAGVPQPAPDGQQEYMGWFTENE